MSAQAIRAIFLASATATSMRGFPANKSFTFLFLYKILLRESLLGEFAAEFFNSIGGQLSFAAIGLKSR